jgi:hypothetical protein
MLVYQLMPTEFALQNIMNGRLKVSLLDDLNDPFELLGARLRTKAMRDGIDQWRLQIASTTRLMCFSRSITNPVLWSHYADKHRGIALGFQVPDDRLLSVIYVNARLGVDLEHEVVKPEGMSEQRKSDLLRTKFAHWQYEDEVRMIVKSDEVTTDKELQFFPFGPRLKLWSVVLGPRCALKPSEIYKHLQLSNQTALVFRTRLGSTSYTVNRCPYPEATP